MSITKFTISRLGVDNPLPKHLNTEENRKLIPALRRHHVYLELKGVSTAIVNAIRRSMLDEIEGKCLKIEQADIDTDDENILWPSVQKQIECMRLNQEIPMNARFTLDIKNQNATPLMITSGMLVTDSDLKITPFNSTFRIITLREGKYLKLWNIRVVSCTGTLASNVVACRYKPLDVEMFDRGKGVSSNNCNPKHFSMEFDTNGTIDPVKLLSSACRYIYERSEKYLNELEHVDSIKTEHSSDLFDINKTGDVTKFIFKNDTYTICNLLSYTIYYNHPDIALCKFGVVHPTEKITAFELKAKDPRKLMIEAFEHIIKLYKDLEQQFLDNKTKTKK